STSPRAQSHSKRIRPCPLWTNLRRLARQLARSPQIESAYAYWSLNEIRVSWPACGVNRPKPYTCELRSARSMLVANSAHPVSSLFSEVSSPRTNTHRKLVSLVTCPFSLLRIAKSTVFNHLTGGHEPSRRLLLGTRMIVYDPPTHREPMKNKRKYASSIPHGALQVPTTQDQSGVGS